MEFEFKLPDIGEGITEGEIVAWHVKDGDSIKEDDALVDVMTDKATVTISSPKTGTIKKRNFGEGDMAPVGDVLVVIEVGDKAAEPKGKAAAEPKREEPKEREEPQEREVAAAPEEPKEREEPKQREEPEKREEPVEGRERAKQLDRVEKEREESGTERPAKPQRAEAGEPASRDHALATPATRKLARELSVDIQRVPGSGKGGRVTKEDVQSFAEGGERPASEQARPAARALAPDAQAVPRDEAREERVPLRGLRRRIYAKMTHAKHTAAHFHYVDEVDFTELVALRERLKPKSQAKGVKLTFLPFIVKACVVALKEFPMVNAAMDDAAEEIVVRKYYDIGIAAATEAGLMVPVVHDADRKSIYAIASDIERLATKARDGQLEREDLTGGTFTITSLGKLGGMFATPIVNYPEVAIVGIHKIEKRPVVVGDEIVVRERMYLSSSFDHRVIDGHVGAAFVQRIKELLEDPESLLIEM